MSQVKEETNYSPLVVIALLLIGGSLYPSNFIDDAIAKSPGDVLANALFVLLCAIILIPAIIMFKTTRENTDH